MPRILIAIEDRVAHDIVGPIQIFPHAAPALRMFGDVAADNRTQIATHVEDHDLVQLGILNDDLTVTAQREILITGAQWKALNQAAAARAAANNNNKERE